MCVHVYTYIHIYISHFYTEFPFNGIFTTSSIRQCSKFSALHHPCIIIHPTHRHTLTYPYIYTYMFPLLSGKAAISSPFLHIVFFIIFSPILNSIL